MKEIIINSSFVEMPEDQGQIQSVAYAHGESPTGGTMYIVSCEVDGSCEHDDPDRTKYKCAEWIDGGFQPWNGILPEIGDWEPCTICP